MTEEQTSEYMDSETMVLWRITRNSNPELRCQKKGFWRIQGLQLQSTQKEVI